MSTISKSIKLITAATSNASTPHPSVSAAEVAGNADLITEILLRLPLKSLIRFKSVSKQWLSLISDPKFALLHHAPSRPSAAGLFLERSDDKYDFVDLSTNPTNPPFETLNFSSDMTSVRITQSCNGLLLCCDGPDYDESSNYFVFNPTTKHHTALPPPPRHTDNASKSYMTYGIALAFDPTQSPHYKAICVRNFSEYDETKFQVDIYLSETRSWRPSTLGFFEAGLDISFERGVFWNGCVHWIDSWGDFLRFEVDTERVHVMAMPPVPDTLDLEDCYRKSAYFAVSGDRLHFIDRYIEPGDTLFKVYEMETDYSGWFVKYVVDVSVVSKAFPDIIWRYDFDEEDNYYVSVLYVVRCEIEEESYLLMNIPGKILRFSFKDETFRILCDVPITDNSEMVSNPSEVYPYIESLAFV